VGGGIAGLVAAITCAEGGAGVRLIEAHGSLGGRARTDEGPYRTNFGPHALYQDGPLWAWLSERALLPRVASPSLGGIRVRWQGQLRRLPPLRILPAVLRLRGLEAPVERDFRSWVRDRADEEVAALLSATAGVFTFHHDPGELSAAFVWPRLMRSFHVPPPARFPIGGWGALVVRLEARARELGVEIELGSAVDALPEPPVIVATELGEAAQLLGDPTLEWSSTHTVCLDVALATRRRDPYVVSDLDECGWIERFTANDRTLAPAGEELVQAHLGMRPGEEPDMAQARLERLFDLSFPEWRARVRWRRRQVMHGRTGALDLPGTSWRDRPAIDRGEGVFLAGDMVAAPGLLSEVAFQSALQAGRGALEAARISRPSLLEVA